MFPKDFSFGAGVSAYQVEGGCKEGGKDLSIWDVYSHKKGNILDGTDGDRAIDFYHRYREDLDLARELGLDDFRFSLAWTRVVKEDGSVNRKGVSFYLSLIEEIKKRGRKPVRTIYHWDRPRWLEKKGGFLPRSVLHDFENLRRVVSRYFAPIMDDFISFNEPQCFLYLGYHHGGHAPNLTATYEELGRRAHHVLLCHALASFRIKSVNKKAKVSFVNTFNVPIPVRDDSLLKEKAKKKLFSFPHCAEEFYTNSIYGDPLYLGHYPVGYQEVRPAFPSFVRQGDRERIGKARPETIDCNIYTGTYYDLDKQGNLMEANGRKGEDSALPWLKKRPLSLYYGSLFRYERYGLPIRITENGGCYQDSLAEGKVHDRERKEYIREYLSSLSSAIDRGIPIRAYYYWSLFDNFEWSEGEEKRFGLVYIDYKNGLKRIKKDSFYFYQERIRKKKKAD